MTPLLVRRGLAVALAGLAVAAAAQAFIPKASRVIRAVAERNDKAGRARALRLDVVLRIEDSEAIGNGTLITHPTGLARLELRGISGLVERHVLQGGEHLATRNGERLAEPRAFLPPLFLLQADGEIALRSGLEQLGADLRAIGLAPCGESDCYVIGDPSRMPPPWQPPRPDDASAPPFDPVRPPARGDTLMLDAARAAIWIDLVSYETKRIDLSDGVVVWLGPPATFGRVQLPSWIRIDEPGKRPATFDVVSASPVDAPAAAFSRSWLERPVLPEAPPAETATGTLSGENP